MKRILVVDGNRDAASVLCDLLQLVGHEVRFACSGAEALAATAAFVPDVVISEYVLGSSDGVALCQHLRTDPRLAHTRFIMLSGFSDPASLTRAREAGFSTYLVKPAFWADLEPLLV